MIERYAAARPRLWLVSLRATGEPIGQVGLLLQHVDGVDEPEIGYMIHAPYWRQGYATRSGRRGPRLCVRHARQAARDLADPAGQHSLAASGAAQSA